MPSTFNNATTQQHTLYVDFFLDVPQFSLNVVKDRLVTWLLQSGINYLLI